MSIILDQIKADQLFARKNDAPITASILTTLLGECDTKSKTGKPGTVFGDDEVIVIIKKFIKSINETRAYLQVGDTEHMCLGYELDALEQYLPKQLTKKEIYNKLVCIDMTDVEVNKQKQVVMKWFKENEKNYDSKLVITCLEEIQAIVLA